MNTDDNRSDACPVGGGSWPETHPPTPTQQDEDARILAFPGTQKEPPPKRGLVQRDDYGG